MAAIQASFNTCVSKAVGGKAPFMSGCPLVSQKAAKTRSQKNPKPQVCSECVARPLLDLMAQAPLQDSNGRSGSKMLWMISICPDFPETALAQLPWPKNDKLRPRMYVECRGGWHISQLAQRPCKQYILRSASSFDPHSQTRRQGYRQSGCHSAQSLRLQHAHGSAEIAGLAPHACTA